MCCVINRNLKMPMIKFSSKSSEINNGVEKFQFDNPTYLPGKFSLRIILGYSAALKVVNSKMIGKCEYLIN